LVQYAKPDCASLDSIHIASVSRFAFPVAFAQSASPFHAVTASELDS
jgi:hypothetical protein